MATRATLLFLVLAASVAAGVPRAVAQLDEEIRQAFVPGPDAPTRAARLRTAADPADPDTVWIGHIDDHTYTAGGTMVAGGYGPYRIGRGPNRPFRSGGSIGDNGAWSFDRFQGPYAPQGAESDSLQGWWPLNRPFQSGATTFPDWRRAFFALDWGNNANYVINQGSPKRTFGVTGLWHRDRGSLATGSPDSIPGTNVQPVLWSPTEVGGAGSTASAWMGMRSHGDLSHVDAIAHGGTGNPFNASVLQYQGNNGFNQIGSVHVNGTDHNFPGYGSQMDQMLYRDVVLAEGQGLTLSFNFSTNMSTGRNLSAGVRAGWFDKDPISNAQVGVGSGATASSDGNFISSDGAGANAPCDSFMVYVGAPVDSGDVLFSQPLIVGGSEITTVYDPRRRWFSEVLRLAGRCAPGSPCTIIGKEILSVAGNNAPTSVSLDFGAVYPAALQAIKDADGVTGNGGTVRIVFRVKTNRGFDDENGGNPSAAFDSGTRGAAIVDNVVVNGWAASNGDFEAPDAIHNDPAVPATAAWKSTGKPPGVYFHLHSVLPGGGLPFDDPCGSLESPGRRCNLYGNIITSGDHDLGEKDGGLFGSNTQDRQAWFASPTINLRASGNGPGHYNAMGIDDEVARTTGDYTVFFSLYNAGMVQATTQTGNFYDLGWQSYPARQANGNITWGEPRHTSGLFFYGARACFDAVGPSALAKSTGLIRTTNPDNRPDSLRVYIRRTARCYSFAALSAATCSPTTGPYVGTYFDNISVALFDASAPPPLSVAIWNLINDAFPANGDPTLLPAGFDTTAAQVRTGINLAAQAPSRPSVAGDSLVVTAPAPGARVDLVFRILPGPGNYMTVGSRASGVSQRPDGKPAGHVAATPGDGSFFGAYMADPGEFGSAAAHPGGAWSAQVWNSARMDTIERNLFPTASNTTTVGLSPGFWRGTYHESDPKYGVLGIVKPICVMPVPTGAVNSTNIACNGTGWGAYGAGSGWDGVTTTKEHTKILPDGLLTPGSHVQYFFRVSDAASPAAHSLAPDTNFILQPAEGSTDGHRWQQFGVLPDRWKDGAWAAADRHAAAPACMLYVDWCDRRGDERVWVGVADSIGATAPDRYGAHNGWHARGDQDATGSLLDVIGTPDDWGVYAHGGQPGTVWDMFGLKSIESVSTTAHGLGNRLAPPGPGLMAGKETKSGPTKEMLRQYYRALLALTGDLIGVLGPFDNTRGDDDVGLLRDFLEAAGGTPRPRLLWMQGHNLVAGLDPATPVVTPQVTFLSDVLGARLVSGDYRTYAANLDDIVDLIPSPPLWTGGSRYSVRNDCVTGNDVLTTTGSFGAAIAAKYADSGTNPDPKIAGVYAPSSLPGTLHPGITLVNGWRISSLGTWPTLGSAGRILYHFEGLGALSAALNCALASGAPVAVGEMPNRGPVDFLGLASANPMRRGAARITFGLARADRAEVRVYDVAGRTVRTLANRAFAAGDHVLEWDGRDDTGQAVPSGVYFYQLRTPSFAGQRKLTVLRH